VVADVDDDLCPCIFIYILVFYSKLWSSGTASRIAAASGAVLVEHEVGVSDPLEFGPALQVLVGVMHFGNAEVADCLLVTDSFAILVEWNGLLNNIHRYVFFNFVPVLNIFFFLLNRL
jgi:hypothetical protein